MGPSLSVRGLLDHRDASQSFTKVYKLDTLVTCRDEKNNEIKTETSKLSYQARTDNDKLKMASLLKAYDDKMSYISDCAWYGFDTSRHKVFLRKKQALLASSVLEN